jgi:hypothetical protein
VAGEIEEAVLIGGAHGGEPIGGDADRQQRLMDQRLERAPGRGRLARRKHEIEAALRRDLLHALARLDDLDRAGLGVRLDPAALGPGIGVVVMADIGDEGRVAALVQDQADVAIDARRPEVRVLALVDAMKLQAVAGRIDLEIEHARLHRLLIRRREAAEGGGEGFGDEEGHCHLTCSDQPISASSIRRSVAHLRSSESRDKIPQAAEKPCPERLRRDKNFLPDILRHLVQL